VDWRSRTAREWSGVCGVHSTESLTISAWGKALPSRSPAYFDDNPVLSAKYQLGATKTMVRRPRVSMPRCL
jgi:hypothetical protein